MEAPSPCHRMLRRCGTPLKSTSPDAMEGRPVCGPKRTTQSAASSRAAELAHQRSSSSPTVACGARNLAMKVSGATFWLHRRKLRKSKSPPWRLHTVPAVRTCFPFERWIRPERPFHPCAFSQPSTEGFRVPVTNNLDSGYEKRKPDPCAKAPLRTPAPARFRPKLSPYSAIFWL